MLQTLLDGSRTTDLRKETDLVREPTALSLQMLTRLQELVGSKKISVELWGELVSKKRVVLLDAVLLTLGVTRTPEIADL